ncbi:MAG: PD-(D/E)XK nuclease-like domain-containing protein, partial [Gammaproteobacteria bacterium]|nr:PD-(D/E)XK nuclease-like domain-containing protein [Gammaproteobacteria bacterium]
QFIAKTLPGEQSTALNFGQAFHLLMESTQAFDEGVVTTDKWKTLQGEAAKNWVADMRSAGKVGILESDLTVLRTMAAMVARHGVVQELIAGTEKEVTFRKSFGKYTIQCRGDCWSEAKNLMVDWKTVPSISDFKKNMVNYHYHCQASWYQQVISLCLEYPEDKPLPRMVFVACEKEAPYEVQPFEIDGPSLDVARGEIMMALRRMKRCFETGNWDRPEEIETIGLPYWYVKQAEERLLKQKARLELEEATKESHPCS